MKYKILRMGNSRGKSVLLDGEKREGNCNNIKDKQTDALLCENANITNNGNGNMAEAAVSLPLELVSDILSRLPIEVVMRYKSVSKGWYALIEDPHFIKMHLSRALCSPRRIILEPRTKDLVTSLCLLSRDDGIWKSREIPIENLAGSYMVLTSCHGLLCVAPDSDVLSKMDPLSIYNPITRKCKELPKTDLKPEKAYISVGFGFDPRSKKYKVVRFFKVYYDEDPQFYMKGQIITLGEESWRELEIPHTVICSQRATPVLLDGALYWLIDKRSRLGNEQILVLDLSNEKFQMIKFPSSIIQFIDYPMEVSLFSFKGSLCLAQPDALHGSFRLWRIERPNTKKGYKFYQSCLLLDDTRYDDTIYSINFLDKLTENCFLFHVEILISLRKKSENDHLLLYFPGKEEYKVLEVSGIPKRFKPNIFVPSLVSPCDAFINGAVVVD